MFCKGTEVAFQALFPKSETLDPRCLNVYLTFVNHFLEVIFQVITAESKKMTVFWVVTHCSLVEVYRRFRGACCLHHQDKLLFIVHCTFYCITEFQNSDFLLWVVCIVMDN
jgi:hypothetical protein